MSRILGLDYGARRLGFAVSDPGKVVATPREVVTVQNDREAAQAVARLCRETGAERLVIGLPLRLDGGASEQTTRVRAFAESLKEQLTIPVELWDERFTTATAEQALIEGGTRRQRRKEVVDKLAAQIMLQHYLDANSREE
jgi:putative Holliday junction resolvase